MSYEGFIGLYRIIILPHDDYNVVFILYCVVQNDGYSMLLISVKYDLLNEQYMIRVYYNEAMRLLLKVIFSLKVFDKCYIYIYGDVTCNFHRATR